MAKASINDLLPDVSYESPKSDVKRQKLIECVLTGKSKQYLRKAYTEECINKLSTEEVDKHFRNYEVKLLGQMVKSLVKSIIRMYSMGACAVLGMSNQDVLSDDLESDPFLNSVLQRFMCELYCRLDSFLSTLSVRLIASRYYLSEQGIKMEMTTPSKYTGLGAAIAAQLMIGFWFGIGVILTVRVVDSLDYCFGALMSSK